MGHVCCPIIAQVGYGPGVDVDRIVVIGTKVSTLYRCGEKEQLWIAATRRKVEQ